MHVSMPTEGPEPELDPSVASIYTFNDELHQPPSEEWKRRTRASIAIMLTRLQFRKRKRSIDTRYDVYETSSVDINVHRTTGGTIDGNTTGPTAQPTIRLQPNQ